ncbi:MAG: radical SAM protein [Candidatus Dormibacter sp.]
MLGRRSAGAGFRPADKLAAAAAELTRGCVHRCRHCPVPAVYGGRLRVVQQETLLADVDQLVEMGAMHLSFADPDFLNAAPYALRAVRSLHQRHPSLSFDITTKVGARWT